MDDCHIRPKGASDDIVAAAGKLSEALETIERARGHLYALHQLIGHADFQMEEAADQLDACGQGHLAQLLRADIIGRNVLDGRWTYQIVEEFESVYYAAIKVAEKRVRDELLDGKRHVFEAEMKERRRSRGRSFHEPEPPRTESGTAATAAAATPG